MTSLFVRSLQIVEQGASRLQRVQALSHVLGTGRPHLRGAPKKCGEQFFNNNVITHNDSIRQFQTSLSLSGHKYFNSSWPIPFLHVKYQHHIFLLMSWSGWEANKFQEKSFSLGNSIRATRLACMIRAQSETRARNWPASKTYHSVRVLCVFCYVSFAFFYAKPQSGDAWSVALANYIRHHDVELLSQADKCLSRFEEEVLPAESFVEFCDVAGATRDVCGCDVRLITCRASVYLLQVSLRRYPMRAPSWRLSCRRCNVALKANSFLMKQKTELQGFSMNLRHFLLYH